MREDICQFCGKECGATCEDGAIDFHIEMYKTYTTDEIEALEKRNKELKEALEQIMALKNNPLTKNQLELLQIIIKIAQNVLKKEDKP